MNLLNLRISAAILCLGVTCLTQAAPGDVNASDYDANNDEMISPPEFSQFIREQHGKSAAAFDMDNSGSLDPHELPALNAHLAEINILIDGEIQTFAIENSGGQALEAFALEWKTKDASNYRKVVSLGGVLLRESHEDISLITRTQATSKVKGATIQFNRNIEDDETTRTFTGVLMKPFYRNNEEGGIFPSLSFNQVRYKSKKEDDVDVLNFRIGTEKLKRWGAGNSEQLYLRFTPVYSTDSHFNSRVPGVELQMEPRFSRRGMGVYRDYGDWLRYRWRGILHLESGKVNNAGDNKELTTGDKFTRLGPRLKLELLFPEFKRFSMIFDYDYMSEVGGDSRDRKYFNSTFNYQLDDSGNLTFQAEYRNGDASLALEDEERFTFGLGLKF